jgi:hypothetical protein
MQRAAGTATALNTPVTSAKFSNSSSLLPAHRPARSKKIQPLFCCGTVKVTAHKVTAFLQGDTPAPSLRMQFFGTETTARPLSASLLYYQVSGKCCALHASCLKVCVCPALLHVHTHSVFSLGAYSYRYYSSSLFVAYYYQLCYLLDVACCFCIHLHHTFS